MNRRLTPQLKNHLEIKNILKETILHHTLSDGRSVKTLLVYLPIKSGLSFHDDFFKVIKDGILYNYVLSCKEIEKKLARNSDTAIEELFEKSIRKISQHTAKGELGELILFTLLDVYFEAPKIVSKVSLKTNSRMPVFGADAVHAQFHDGKLRLYLGESKLYTKFKSAATEATKSIKTAKDKYEEEFDLLDSYMDFPDIDDDIASLLIDLLNPFTNNRHSESIYSPCFIGFSEEDIISTCVTEQDFIEKYKLLSCDYINDFFKKVEEQNMSIEETALLMLPFSCVDKLVDDFIAYVGIKK
ncbi:DUF1837 domain-containing protein [Acerihabitans sp. KWT182]|uniref:DUF1837 domain-containing protein n=1 Tax=Acerihabitans sp. KWT182 TaxID=3157919 RepID=A0AAU7Q9W7_9GAMM